MIRALLFSIASTIGLSACAASAAAAPPNPAYLAAHLLAGEPAALKGEAKPQPLGVTGKQPAVSGAAAAGAAKSVALHPDDGASAVQLYPWAEGAIYRLETAVEQVSDIELQPGETLLSVAAGDTARWVIGDTVSGSGSARRAHVLVKPTAPSLHTNLLIATDRRLYHVGLESGAKAAMAGIVWTYPEDGLIALRAPPAAPDSLVAAEVAVETLNFGYRIEGDSPPWRPLRAFDDGRQTFIEFPPTLSQGDAPPLFVTGDGGRAELVNYRVRGRYYVVDRLFAAAELRLGERHQQVVCIVRQNFDAKPGRSGS